MFFIERGMVMQKDIIFIMFVLFLIIFLVNFASADFFDWFGKITGRATQQNTNASTAINGTNGVTITISNATISTVTPTENSFTTTTFYVQVTDADGVSDINDTAVNASFSKSGETTRQNSSCSLVSDISSTAANYSCAVNIWYYDNSGTWNMTACGKDLGNMTYVCNSSATFTYNQLQALAIAPNALTWATLTIGANNQTSNNDPTIVNNTGNYNFTNMTVRGFNLHGETLVSSYIQVGNFTVANKTGSSVECDFSYLSNATLLSNGTNIQIKQTVLLRGNNSVNDGVTGQEQLYYCINTVPQVGSQTYSTTYIGGSWLVIGTT